MLSIKLKIVLAYTVVFGLMLTAFAIVIYESTEQAEFSKLDANLKSYTAALQTKIAQALSEDEPFDIKEIRNTHARGLSDARFQLFTSYGKNIITDSLLLKAPLINFDEKENVTFHYGNFHLNKEKYRVLWLPFETEQDSIYVLQTAASIKDVYEDLDRLFYIFVIIIPLGLILTGITAYFISKAAFKPVTQMADTAKNISGKNLEQRLALPKAKDEIRTLGETLNEMIERLDDAFKSQKRFVADASHEIRTPLTVIQTELEILERKLSAEDGETKESIRNVLNEIESLTKLTNSLLTLSKLDAQVRLNLSPVRIDELLTDCVQLMNASARRKNVKLNLHITDAVEIEADREKLKSVFVNLIDNAVKFSNHGSSVSVILDKIENGKVKAAVSDNGCGISALELPYIFKRFYRSNEIRSEVEGNGLGLAIVKEIIDMHRGTITVESEPGKGTTFYVVLPAKSER